MTAVQKNSRIPAMPVFAQIVCGAGTLAAVVLLMPNDDITGKLFYGAVATAFIVSGVHSVLKKLVAPTWVLNASALLGWVNIIVLIGALIAELSYGS